jgi:hypothetical protein
MPIRNDFWTAFDRHEKAILATPEGQQFTDDNFSFCHTGGGCTAWEREIDDTGCRVWITDSSGTHAMLTVADDGGIDYWLIGAHGYDGGFSACRKADTIEQALDIADEIHRLVIAKDWAALDGDNADLPLTDKPCQTCADSIETRAAPALAKVVQKRHSFQAIQRESDGSESVLDTFVVTAKRTADAAYVAAEELCERARALPHRPAAFVREINEPAHD